MHWLLLMKSLIRGFLPLFFTLWFRPGALGACPDESLLRPCTCSGPDNLYMPSAHVTCSGLSSEGDVQGVIDHTVDYPFPYFSLIDVHFPHLDSSWLREKRVQWLDLRNCVFVSLLENENIEPLPMVTDVFINSSMLLRKVRWTEFRPFIGLIRLYVTGTEVRKLGPKFQNVSHNLEKLYLIGTKISNLEGEPFKGKTKLLEIFIENGKIRELRNSYFEDQKDSLSILKLSGNPIESLPQDIFKGFKELVIVFLDRTKLKSLPSILFEERTNNGRLYHVENCPLRCDCSMKWIVTSRRSDNGIRGTCDTPSTLSSRLLDQLTSSDFEACDDYIELQTITSIGN